jgi:cytochrome c-type biogenesis protein CcmH
VRILVRSLVALFLFGFSALAVEPDETLADPALEARARGLSSELRCMVCQNQSIDDSSAPLARDLRILVRERIRSGSSDAEVLDYLVARYGEFILLRPRFGRHTLLLWLGPPAVLGVAALGICLAARKRRHVVNERASPLDQEEQASLDLLLSEREHTSRA